MRAVSGPSVLVVEHEADADAALIGLRLASAGLHTETVGPERDAEIPGSLEGFDALLVLGGDADPDDDLGAPWLPATRSLLRSAVRDQVPTMAVCLGAQLLGMAVGARARQVENGPEIGLLRVRPGPDAAADELLRHIVPHGRRALQWHWWEVSDLPPECEGHRITVLADSDRCAVQAFVIGEVVWGLQFHLEALGRTARAWAGSAHERLTEVGIDPRRLVAQVAGAEDELIAGWTPVIDAWAATVRSRAITRHGG